MIIPQPRINEHDLAELAVTLAHAAEHVRGCWSVRMTPALATQICEALMDLQDTRRVILERLSCAGCDWCDMCIEALSECLPDDEEDSK